MRHLALACLLAPCLAAAAPVNLLTNGSFEDISAAAGVQQLAAGTWSVFSAIPGWTAAAGGGIEVRNSNAGLAFDGNQFVELDAYNNSIMFQQIATDAGIWYDLSFYYSPRPGVTSPADTNNITVFWNGVALDTRGGQGTGQHDWQKFSYLVQGTGLDELRFAATGTSDSLGGSLDMVSLSVPEPASLTLALGALLAAGGARRRRTVTA